ncbi:MAG: zinc-dependent peptidase [Deltaproteobacteria bacterium]|nr:zinc-dependent peptidase [Deltaproteobacteria bacterium]
MFGLKKRRRRRWRSQPLPRQWIEIIERNVPCYQHLAPDERNELHGHIQVFLHEKDFEGCEGLEITDEIRVTIAAQACILLLHRETDYFPFMSSILVYPQHYFAFTSEHLSGGLVQEGIQARLGESWKRGPIVLSWNDVLRGAADPNDGHNVVFHEFAHQLDSESGTMEGAPILPDATMYTAWARVLSNEFNSLLIDLEQNHRHLIDAYGASSPAEFFAVVTEAFFEKPLQLKSHHPELYEQMRSFYQQDPASRLTPGIK